MGKDVKKLMDHKEKENYVNTDNSKNRMKNEKPTNRKEGGANSANSADGNIFDAFEKGFSSGGDAFGKGQTDFEIPVQEY